MKRRPPRHDGPVPVGDALGRPAGQVLGKAASLDAQLAILASEPDIFEALRLVADRSHPRMMVVAGSSLHRLADRITVAHARALRSPVHRPDPPAGGP